MDMNKAYDRVEWDFLEGIMVKIGFERKWIWWIMKCISSVSCNLIVNGKQSGTICPTRGLRQRDPYLFLFIVDVLSKRVNNAFVSNRLSGIKLSKECHSLLICFLQMILCSLCLLM